MTAPQLKISFDRQDTLLYFQTVADDIAMQCAVSKAALAHLEDDALGGAGAMARPITGTRAASTGLPRGSISMAGWVVIVRSFDVQI
jgi:hypothetical protein